MIIVFIFRQLQECYHVSYKAQHLERILYDCAKSSECLCCDRAVTVMYAIHESVFSSMRDKVL